MRACVCESVCVCACMNASEGVLRVLVKGKEHVGTAGIVKARFLGCKAMFCTFSFFFHVHLKKIQLKYQLFWAAAG